MKRKLFEIHEKPSIKKGKKSSILKIKKSHKVLSLIAN